MKRTFLFISLITGISLANVFALPASAQRQLPPVRLDSFVREAGAQAELIYGDEGTTSIPPIDNFKKENRIDAGIHGVSDLGLTTGHGSVMPDAWGADEFISPPGEWTQSGAKGNLASYTSISATNLDSRTSNHSNPTAGGGSGGNYPPPDGPPPPGQEWNPIPLTVHGEFDGYMTVQEATDYNSGDPAKTAAAYQSYALRTHGGLTTNDQYIIHSEILQDGTFQPTF